MSKLAILHFSPLELYPPVQNLLYILKDTAQREKIVVFSTNAVVKSLKSIHYNDSGIQIKRLGHSGQKVGKLRRYWTYFYFNIGVLIYLFVKRPASVLYYESISSFPAYLYKKYLNKQANIFIHYHEYTTPDEYANGMKQTYFFYKREKWLYTKSVWISHTNELRLKKFLVDISPISVLNPQVFPNYPPLSWCRRIKHNIDLPIKVVYAGALSLKTMYLKEFVEWLILQNGKLVFDIYSYNMTEDAMEFLSSVNSEWVNLKSGVNYDEMPDILSSYDVGVILYKGHIPNYIYNAPNKLFEYFAIGLDVWFPNLMKGSLPYITKGTFPKISSLDFNSLENVLLEELISHIDHQFKPSKYYCEAVASKLVNCLIGEEHFNPCNV